MGGGGGPHNYPQAGLSKVSKSKPGDPSYYYTLAVFGSERSLSYDTTRGEEKAQSSESLHSLRHTRAPLNSH